MAGLFIVWATLKKRNRDRIYRIYKRKDLIRAFHRSIGIALDRDKLSKGDTALSVELSNVGMILFILSILSILFTLYAGFV